MLPSSTPSPGSLSGSPGLQVSRVLVEKSSVTRLNLRPPAWQSCALPLVRWQINFIDVPTWPEGLSPPFSGTLFLVSFYEMFSGGFRVYSARKWNNGTRVQPKAQESIPFFYTWNSSHIPLITNQFSASSRALCRKTKCPSFRTNSLSHHMHFVGTWNLLIGRTGWYSIHMLSSPKQFFICL
jgi:hypothetical protein